MQKPLKVNVHVVTKSGVIPYDSLSPEEKKELGIRLNRRAMQAAARADGYVLEFDDSPSTEVGTA